MGMSRPRGTYAGDGCSAAMTSRVVLMVAMVLALAGAVPSVARADWDDRPDPAEFEESLSPDGYWVDEPTFGHVWRPYAGWDWRPYTAGRWIWTSYGWTWDSVEPWGWTFHYGRWGFSNLYGWVWTPGYTWGPAWVDWYWGDGYVGWVPLGPRGFVVTPTYWTYVRDYSFCSPRVTDVVVIHDRVPRYIMNHREQGWGSRHAPDLRDVERVSQHRIVRENDRPRGSVAPWVEHRIQRGEEVRERVVDRGSERVIDHPGRGPEGRNAGSIRDDGWRRRGDRRDDHGPGTMDRRVDHGDTLDRGTVSQPPGNDRRSRDVDTDVRVRPNDVDRRPSGRGDDGVVAPRNNGWNRPPSSVDVDRRPQGGGYPDRGGSPYRGGGDEQRGGSMQHGQVEQRGGGMQRGQVEPPARAPQANGGPSGGSVQHGGGNWGERGGGGSGGGGGHGEHRNGHDERRTQ